MSFNDDVDKYGLEIYPKLAGGFFGSLKGLAFGVTTVLGVGAATPLVIPAAVIGAIVGGKLGYKAPWGTLLGITSDVVTPKND